jgi:hypothetical protein
MRKLTLVIILLGFTAPAARRGERATYVGGTLTQVAKGTPGALDLGDQKILRFAFKNTTYDLPYERIRSLELGQKHRAMLLLRKVDDLLTIGFSNADGSAGVLVLELTKGVSRFTLPTLEARSGKKVDHQREASALPAGAPPAAPAPAATIPQYTLGALTVVSKPLGASVEVDGYGAGRTPTMVKLMPGSYTVTVHASGFRPWSQKLTVEPGESRKVGVELAEITEVKR